MSNIEFLVHDVRFEQEVALISGIVNKGEILEGTTFIFARQESTEVQNVHLVVSKIIAYRREIDSLPTGMSGELHLIGRGVDMVVKHSMLEA